MIQNTLSDIRSLELVEAVNSSAHETSANQSNHRYKAGDVVWPFRIQRVLGSGAMGDVYVAQHVTDRNRVALKFMPENLRKDKVLSARFQREMKVLQGLRHPSIIRCLTNVEQDDAERPYYAMEYVSGGTFEDLLRLRVRLSPEETFHYAVQILGALSAAHRSNVLHRDVKPSNLLLSKDHLAIKLCDFGLAMVLGGTQLTRPGQAVGTPWYMSPEQIRGEDSIGAQADLYSVGCILMEALTGKPPFTGDTSFAILNRHLTDEPPLVSSRIPNLSNGAFIDRLVSRLLEKDPNNRPHSAGELIGEIGKVFRLPGTRRTASAGDPAGQMRADSDGSSPRSQKATSPADSSPIRVARARWQDFWHGLRLNQSTTLLPICVASLMLNILLFFAYFSSGLSSFDRDWIKKLPQQPADVRAISADVLALLAKTDSVAEETLIALLDAPEEKVRQRAVLALARLGSDADSYRAKVSSLTRDSSSMVRYAATTALAVIDGEAPLEDLDSL